MNVRYRITLTVEERDELRRFVQAGKGAFRRLKRAQILLASEAGSLDKTIAENISVSTSTVFRTKRRFVEEGLDASLSELPRPGADRLLAEKEEALLIATACSAPPSGRSRWTLDLLAGAMVRLTRHDSISSETIRRRLAENQLKPWLKKMWCISAVGAEFIARMEDVLDLYAEKPDDRFPVICFDETPRQLREKEVVAGLAVQTTDPASRRGTSYTKLRSQWNRRPWWLTRAALRRSREELSALRGRCSVDAGDEALRRDGRIVVAIAVRHAGADEAGMQHHHGDSTWGEVTRHRHAAHVERRLRHAIAVQTARTVVADRPGAARDHRYLRALPEPGKKAFREAKRSERVHLVLPLHRVEVERLESVGHEHPGVVEEHVDALVSEGLRDLRRAVVARHFDARHHGDSERVELG